MRVEALPPAVLAPLVEVLADIRHDLGKYICFEQRFLAADAPLDQRRAALIADVGQTRRSGERVESAMDLWARMRPAQLDGDEDVDFIDAEMGLLSQLWQATDPSDVERALAAAQAIARATRSLHGRALAQAGEGSDG